ncbi:AAHS family 4-hydroxybenzoate transporter-like MFS transporter [Altererythrobacter atlanticus]|uniref:4-hydroxybenzoate transporter PcaK n=1 Tax=Croceibacterium atlanticum TaxID=1267766 RepID=A0A0F7KKJ0_9SPHN|nr:MFS transporter [Croceibacterium atlanticum]AKH41108.1 4-hydroxybenzoate transporter PcaK [Croceibacterium atlanticum]MBB5732623.1 AAHS family 4-hydroxybenzoate transporter-like MFS transporter [Croceibacterium atlanticum]
MKTTFSDALSRISVQPFQWLTVAVCMLILVADGMDLQLLGIVAPLVMESFGTDSTTFGWAMGAALVGFGIGSWAGGQLGDGIGRRWTLAIAALVFSLATVGAGTATDVWQMAGWRLVGGLGFGAAYANALAMAGEWLPDRWRPVTVSTLSVGTPIGGTIVGWIGPDLAAAHGWEGTFVRIGLATMVLVLIIAAALRDSPSFLLASGKTERAQRNAKLVLKDDLTLLPERHETDTEDGPSIGVLHKSNARVNAGIALAFAAAAMVAYSILSWTTVMLTQRGFTLAVAGNAVAWAGITSMIGSIIVGIAMRRFGSKPVMLVISAVLMALMIGLGSAVEGLPASPDAAQQALVTWLIAAAGGFFSAAIAGMYVMMTYAYPQSCRSAGIGFGIFMSRVGAISATAFGGGLLAAGGESTMPFFAVLTVSAALIAAAAFVVDRHVPSLAEAERRRLAMA